MNTTHPRLLAAAAAATAGALTFARGGNAEDAACAMLAEYGKATIYAAYDRFYRGDIAEETGDDYGIALRGFRK